MSSIQPTSVTKRKGLFVHQGGDLYGSDLVFHQVVETLMPHVEPVVVLGSEGALIEKLREVSNHVEVVDLGVLRRKSFTPGGILRNGLAILRSTCYLRRLIRQEDVDFVYTNTLGVLPGALAAKLTRRPHFWHVHEIIERPVWLGRVLSFLAQTFSRDVIAVSNAVADHLIRSWASPRKNVRVVHNGIAFAPFEQARSGKIRREYGVSDQTFLVALVGRIHYWKGQDQLIKAASILKEQGLADFRILMVGDVFPGYEHLLDRLKNEVAALSLESHVVFCGFRDDVPDVLRDADVVVIPSTLPDPFPTVALEAMIAAKPVIASATGGLVEMIEDGVTGYLVPPSDPETLAQKLGLLARNVSTRQSMGQQGRRRVEALFSPEAFQRNITDVVLNALDRPAGIPGQTRLADRPLKIALLGTRGIPASYSGFETCVEQLGQRLAEKGHSVTVYCRSHHITYPGHTYKGMRLVKLPTIRNKYLDTIVHAFLSSIHALPRRYDIALYFIAGNSPVTWIPRLVGTRTILNVDGLDWKREKWPAFAKKYLQFAEYLATKLPTCFITDSVVVQEYYRQRFGSRPVYIPYGSEIERLPPDSTLTRFQLEKGKYVLFVGRLVPENCAHHLIEAFRGLDTDLKCVIVGDAAYAEEYRAALRAQADGDSRIVFTGYVFGKGYHELGSNACIFVETSGVGGTHPALVEAMAFGNCVIVNNTPENLETIGTAGFHYDGAAGGPALRTVLERLIATPALIAEYRSRASERARTTYQWGAVTDTYEALFYRLLGGRATDRSS